MMGLSAFGISVVCALATVASVEGSGRLTKVSIYYESRCPDSVNFIANQLYPNYQALRKHILVDFVPYGKATQSKNSNGAWEFHCQHGYRECDGNEYQACALDQNKGQDANVNFVNCVMTSSDPSEEQEIQDCAVSNGFNWQTISSCHQGNRGDELLASYGTRTHNLTPKLRFVPTIVYNDVFDQTLQNESLEDFLKVACSQIPHPKPNACNN